MKKLTKICCMFCAKFHKTGRYCKSDTVEACSRLRGKNCTRCGRCPPCNDFEPRKIRR